MSDEERFWSKVDKSGDCWLWTGYLDQNGYGRFHSAEQNRGLTHRYAWFLKHGPIPEGMVVCHGCDNPTCVRWSHLFVGTQLDNIADMNTKGRTGTRAKWTHCLHGHEFTPDNTYVYKGERACRTCRNETMRRWRAGR